MKLSPNAQKVLEKRFLAPRKGGHRETWTELCQRVARRVSSVETDKADRNKWEALYQDLIENLNFLPNSPVLRNFGRNKGSGSACFVLPINDSRRSIFKTLSDAVDVQAYGGGTGFSFSRLRPKGDLIKSTSGHASGPVSFLELYDYTIGNIICQGGVRKGANMGILRVDHPDIEAFITAKQVEGKLANFNISVGITDDFMAAMTNDQSFNLVFKSKTYRSMPAKEIWHLIVDTAWKNGEPGLVFLDSINRANPLAAEGEIEATNPCGEQPLLPYGSCTLGSINLANMVSGDWPRENARLDLKKLAETVAPAVRFLDSVISVNTYPVKAIRDMALQTRSIGLGVMGFADLNIKLGITYGSPESVALAKQVMRQIYDTADKTSRQLGREKGHAQVLLNQAEADKSTFLRRNALLTSIAPTGTLSLIADCAGGCEPIFALRYNKACLDGENLSLAPKIVNDWIAHNGPDLPDYFITAGNIPVEHHIAIQAAFQNNGVDAGVSKTINLPAQATRQDIEKAYILAYQAGCKGITVYRDGSRTVEAMRALDVPAAPPLRPDENAQDGQGDTPLKRGELKSRPRVTTGPSIRINTACGKLYVDPHLDMEGIIEIFVRTIGGGCAANTEALGVLMSYCLRAGIDPNILIKAMKKITCPACTKAIASGNTNVEVISCAAGLGKALEVTRSVETLYREIADRLCNGVDFDFGKIAEEPLKTGKQVFCEDCGKPMRPDAGCYLCEACGWSKC